MIAFQIVGGLVAGFLLVAILYERITTGTIVDSKGAADSDTEARLFWTPLPCEHALDVAIRDYIRGGPEEL